MIKRWTIRTKWGSCGFLLVSVLDNFFCDAILNTIMDTAKLTLDLFWQVPEFPLAVVPVPVRAYTEPDYTSIPHYHDFLELVVIAGGSGTQWINEVKYPVVAGDVFVLQGNDRHYFTERSSALRLYNILYDPGKLPLPQGLFRRISNYNMIFRVETAFRKQQDFISRIHLDISALDCLEKQITGLSNILKKQEEGFEVEAVTVLSGIILSVCRNTLKSDKSCRETIPDGMNKVIFLLDNEFTRSYPVAELARYLHTSPRNFTRLFTKFTSCSPIEYLLRARLQYAAELLVSSDLSCNMIALRSGFRDSNYFSRCFSARYGLSPREYRKYNQGR